MKKNFLSWILDAEIHLDAMNLGNTIKGGNTASLQDRANTLIFLRYHIDECLKNYNQSQNKNNTCNNQKLNRLKKKKLPGKATGPHNKKVYETECYKCRMKGH